MFMKQKELTEKQREIIGRLEAVLEDANNNQIGFVYDTDDCSLTAFNIENVFVGYAGRTPEIDGDERLDFDYTHPVMNFNADHFNSFFDDFYLNFEP